MCCRCYLLVILAATGSIVAEAQEPNQFRFTSFNLDDEKLVLSWDGGTAPYQVQSSLSSSGGWSAETSEVVDKSRTIFAGLDAERRFFRVASGDDIIPPANAIVSPASGVALVAPLVSGHRNTDVTFTWEAGGAEPELWWFYVGTEANRSLYFNSGQISSDSRQVLVPSIPFDGEDVVVNLWWRSDAGNWINRSYTYGTEALGQITSPEPGDRLRNSGIFQLHPNGLDVAVWWVYVGSTVGGREYSNGGRDGTAPGSPVLNYSNVPNDNSTVYVRLFWKLSSSGAAFESRDYEFRSPEAPVGPS